MSFPYTYKNNISYTGEVNIDRPKTVSEIRNNIYGKIIADRGEILKSDNNSLQFSTKNSFFNLEYKIQVSIKSINNNHSVNYEIEMEKITRIILFGVIFLAFFSFISVTKFLIFAGLFVILFYSVNLFFINSYVSKIIDVSLGNSNYDFEGSETLSDEQVKWQNDPNRCPACGSEITNFDLHCPECGLKVKQNKFSVPLDISKYKDATVRYHLKNEEEK